GVHPGETVQDVACFARADRQESESGTRCSGGRPFPRRAGPVGVVRFLSRPRGLTMSSRRRAVRRDAFTRTDVIAITVLLGVLIGLLLPAIPTARVKHTNIQSANNLRQMALAMNTAALNYNQLPPSLGVYPKGGSVNGTVFFHMLPFMEEENIYNFVAGT